MHDAIRGSEAVFHLAAWYKVGARNTRRAELINVQGTQNVLELAFNLKVPRILYTSTIGCLRRHARMTSPMKAISPPPGLS